MKEEILALRASGKTYDAIKAELGCSKATINYYGSKDGKEKLFRRNQAYVRSKIIQLKLALGGKCSVCGYGKCQEALEFHHPDPSNKDAKYNGITHMLNSCSFKKAETEAHKCVLLCANCHREIHAGWGFTGNTRPILRASV